MDELSSATYFGRTLLTLARARATGVLHVEAPSKRARVLLQDGAVAGVCTPDGAPEGDLALGDLLLREGVLDAAAHGRALEAAPPTSPVGDWLVRAGLADAPAVAHALRKQLRRRVQRLFAWPSVSLRFEDHTGPVGTGDVEATVASADLVLDVMRRAAEARPLAELDRVLGREPLRLAPAAEGWLEGAALHPHEEAVLALLRYGLTADEALGALASSAPALRTLWVLKMLRAVAPPGPEAAAYPLLLRKRRQVRQRRTPAELLDIGASAPPAEARRALRRLARTLHPDRFGDAAPAAVRQASNEVMTALVQAEARLRGR